MKKSKLCTLILAFASTMVAAFAVSACGVDTSSDNADGGEKPACEHEFGEFTVTQPSTCAEEGSQSATCGKCGETVTESIPKKSHSEITIKGKPAKYRQEGLSDGKYCTSCKTTTVPQQKIPALIKLTATADSTTFGSVAEFDPYVNQNSAVPLTAIPNEGCSFQGWYKGDELLSTELTYSFEVGVSDCEIRAVFSAFSKGTGTVNDPYLITSAADLTQMANLINVRGNTYYNKHYKLVNDVDLANKEWTPIGKYYYEQYNYDEKMAFRGTFDGGGHVVSNLKMTLSYNVSSFEREFGLFGLISTESVIKNLGVENVNIAIDTYSGFNVGGIASYSNGRITNCYVKGGSITAKTKDTVYAGGLVGNGAGQVDNCYTDVDVSAESSRTYRENDKIIYPVFVGGVCGYIRTDYGTTAVNCYALGDVSGKAAGASHVKAGSVFGAVVGSYIEIKNCLGLGNVTANSPKMPAYGGGVIGHVDQTTAQNCHHYEGITVTVTGGTPINDGYSASVTAETVNSAAFYLETLGWDSSVWDLTSLDFANGKTPTLKVFAK